MGCRPRAQSVLHCHGVWGLRQGPWTRADGRKKHGLQLVARGPDPSFTAMVFAAQSRTTSTMLEGMALSLSIYLASRTTSTGPCQPSLSLSLYRLGDRRSHSHMLMHCFSCQHAQKIWDDKLWCWLSCRIMHWISLGFSLMLCTPISQTQHRAVEAALSSSKIAFTLQIASLQRLYRSFCPVWFCTYFASTSIYHGNMTLQCPGVGGRGRSPLIRRCLAV